MKYLKNVIFLFFFFQSCVNQYENSSIQEKDSTIILTEITPKDSIQAIVYEISQIEQTLIDAGLVDIQAIDSSIHVDVKYATTANFMHQVLYPDYDRVYLQRVVAERLSKCQTALKKKDSTLTLLVYDGARPRFVQQQMWDALDTIPIHERTKFLSNPNAGSLHNFGCAVDLTILDTKTGQTLDMGAGYDDLRRIAYPRLEEYYLQNGELRKEQIANRQLLREIMRVGGFWVIQTEWWHFNAYSRDRARELFEIIE